MSSIGDSIGRSGFAQLGSGFSVPPQGPPPEQSMTLPSFEGGLDLSDAPEDIAQDAASFAVDMEVENNALKRSAGITQLQDLSPRVIRYMFEQGSPDFTSELVAIDPPYICVKTSGDMVCTDMAVGATGDKGWRAISVAGTLLFSNGESLTYTRDFAALVVNDISAQIVADTFAQVFGRVFAGGIRLLAGDYQALGIAWSSSADPVSDWAGAGAGAELLIADQARTDKVVALRSIGFDVLGIMNRYSLWAGYPTGDADRPADFRPRVMSVGCVNEATAVTTPQGIMMLSDDGVLLYDINSANVISKAINKELLPIDYSQLSLYRASYDARKSRYILTTPFETWIYELPKPGVQGRWFHRSMIVDSIVPFAEQDGGFSWESVVGTWAEQTRTWEGMTQDQSNAPGTLHYSNGPLLGKEDSGSSAYFGTAMTPIWRSPFGAKERITDQYNTLGFEILYSALEAASITLQLTDSTGAFSGAAIVKTLPSTNGEFVRRRLYTFQSGMNSALQIQINSGSPLIRRVKQIVQLAGPDITSL